MMRRNLPLGATVRPTESSAERNSRYASSGVISCGAMIVTFLLLAGIVPGSTNCLQVIDEIQEMRSPRSVSGFMFSFTIRRLAGNFLQELNSFSPASSPVAVGPGMPPVPGARRAPRAAVSRRSGCPAADSCREFARRSCFGVSVGPGGDPVAGAGGDGEGGGAGGAGCGPAPDTTAASAVAGSARASAPTASAIGTTAKEIGAIESEIRTTATEIDARANEPARDAER